MSKQSPLDPAADDSSNELDADTAQQQGEREQDERNRENEQHDGSQSEQQSAQWTGEEMSRDERTEHDLVAKPSETSASMGFDQGSDTTRAGEVEGDEPMDEAEDDEELDEEAEEEDEEEPSSTEAEQGPSNARSVSLTNVSGFASR